MNWLVTTSLRLRVLVLAASIVLMIYGIFFAGKNLERDLLRKSKC